MDRSVVPRNTDTFQGVLLNTNWHFPGNRLQEKLASKVDTLRIFDNKRIAQNSVYVKYGKACFYFKNTILVMKKKDGRLLEKKKHNEIQK